MSNRDNRVRRVQELRRSSAARPHRNRAKYTRKTKHKHDQERHNR